MLKAIRNQITAIVNSVASSVSPVERVNNSVIASYALSILALSMGVALGLSMFVSGADSNSFRLLLGVCPVVAFFAWVAAFCTRLTRRSPVKTMHLKSVLAVLFLLFGVPCVILLVPGVLAFVQTFLLFGLGFVMPWVFIAAIGFLLINLYRYMRLQPPLISLTSSPGSLFEKRLIAAVPVVYVLSVLSLYLIVVGVGIVDFMVLLAKTVLLLSWVPVLWRLVTCDGKAHFIQAADRCLLLLWAEGLASLLALGLVVAMAGAGSLAFAVIFLVFALTLYPMILIGFVKLHKASVRVLFKGQSFFDGFVKK